MFVDQYSDGESQTKYAMEQLIQGDCLERMRKLDSGSVDLIITRPPSTRHDLELYSEQMAEMVRLLSSDGQIVFNHSGDLAFARRAISTTDAKTVFDPAMGNGITGIAAALEDRHFIGIEADDALFEAACQRIGDFESFERQARRETPPVAVAVAVKPSFDLICGDALETLKTLEDDSVHLCITDPPYFLGGAGDDWKPANFDPRAGYRHPFARTVGGAFDTRQGPQLQAFMADISKEIFRVLKPGGFMVSFSQARLYHRLAVAVEDAGFEMRDMLAWTYRSGQARAMAQDHFIDRLTVSDEEKAAMKAAIDGRKTAMLKPCIEPMTLAQKPKDGTYVANWLKHRTGLIDVTQSFDDGFPANVMECSKPNKAERGEGNDHPTVKPVMLIEHLVRLLSVEGQTVLDPFAGSGSHGVAAIAAGRSFIGIEREPKYVEIARRRLT